MEAVPLDRSASVDSTAVAGHGLLVEMSHAELKARLVMLREVQAAEEDLRRQTVFDSKVEWTRGGVGGGEKDSCSFRH